MTAVLTLHRLAYATTTAEAGRIAREALDSGADPSDVAVALMEWARLQGEQVQAIRADQYDPSPEPVQRRTS